jgi:hypothetical protein
LVGNLPSTFTTWMLPLMEWTSTSPTAPGLDSTKASRRPIHHLEGILVGRKPGLQLAIGHLQQPLQGSLFAAGTGVEYQHDVPSIRPFSGFRSKDLCQLG